MPSDFKLPVPDGTFQKDLLNLLKEIAHQTKRTADLLEAQQKPAVSSPTRS